MKKIKIALAIIVSFALASCQKEYSTEDAAGTIPTPFNKVKTYTEDLTSGGTHTVTTFDLSYDNSNRLISLISETNDGDKFVFNYSSGSYTGDIFNSNALSIHEVFFLNSNLFVDRVFSITIPMIQLPKNIFTIAPNNSAYTKEYDYSLLTGSVLTNTTNYKYDSNDNQISASDNYSVTLYDYTAFANSIVIGAPYFFINKKLVKTATYSFGVSTIILNHTYTFDGSNRLST